MIPLFSWPKNKPSKKLASKQVQSTEPTFMMLSCMTYPSTIKTEATSFFEMSFEFQQSTQRYILEDGTLHINELINLIYSSHFKVALYSQTVTLS
jgi:hypothetical protein